MTRRNKIFWVLGILAVLLVGARVALPYFVKDEFNRRLMALESYDGHVEDVDLALWRGAYRVDDIRIVKTGSKQPEPFFDAERIDFSVEWRSLLRGRVVAECEMFAPNAEPGALGVQVAVAARHGGQLGGPARTAVPVPLQHHRRARRHRDLPCAGDRLEGRARGVATSTAGSPT